MSSVDSQLQKGFNTAFIDRNCVSNMAFRPQFLSNNYLEGRKVLTSIDAELKDCKSFSFSVAFITEGGIKALQGSLKELERKGVPGRILTTDYQTFTEPDALRILAGLENIEVRMYFTEGEKDSFDEGFHTKGYLFEKEHYYSMIVGSSNMTRTALTINKEWNSRIVSKENGEYARQVLSEFDDLWNSEKTRTFQEFIDSYEIYYNTIKMQRSRTRKEEIASLENYKLSPNTMQLQFIKNLHSLIEEGENKALLISATGTGKTFASAFALRNEEPQRILFLVHREQIAKQAINSYKRVFDPDETYGLISGHQKEDSDFQARYIFSTMQMMSKNKIMQRYSPDDFDIIVIDEVHRAGAESYQRIMKYFTPKLWLGMTASPERTDNFDIFGLFDHNIAYEIRLRQALEENLLCPFHYFGITDLMVDGKVMAEEREFQYLTSEERVKHILAQAEYYGYSGDRVKGLVFCSRKDEAKKLSEMFNERGYRTAFASGESDQEKRAEYVERLTTDGVDDPLDYLFTVDIFNEGVDIPEINQVIMLRPTESPIIFVQQLGRGLRKAEGKEFLVVLDFIGNYTNNYMIPIALSGDRSYNKDNMRKYVSNGTRVIPGSSSIYFDEVARKQIYDSIDSARTDETKLIKDVYFNLKNKLGRIPRLKDFEEHDAMDVMKIISKFKSYYKFLSKYEKEYDISLSLKEEEIVNFLSEKLANGKRLYELLVLKEVLERKERLQIHYENLVERMHGKRMTELEKSSVYNMLTNRFAKNNDQQKYIDCVFVEDDDGTLRAAQKFVELLENESFRKMAEEIVDFGLDRYQKYYSDSYKDTSFVLYQKYTYEDVCRLLNWKTNMNAQNIGGYFYEKETKTLPVFINYDKAEDAIAYNDRFVSTESLIALSKKNRKTGSLDADHFYKRTLSDKDNRIYLFVRKNKDDKEAKEFYFLGEIEAVDQPIPIEMIEDNGKKVDAFEINYHLDVPVREDIYQYIVGE